MTENELYFTPSAPYPALTLTQNNAIIFSCGGGEEVIRLDEKGMVYMGKRIEDAGEARQAFLAAMDRIGVHI